MAPRPGIRIKNLVLSYGQVSYPNADCDHVCGCHQLHRQFERLGACEERARAEGQLIALHGDEYIAFKSLTVAELEHKGLVLAQRPDENSSPHEFTAWTAMLALAKRKTKGKLRCSSKTGSFRFVVE